MTQTTSVTPESPQWILMAKALKGELSDQEQKDFTAWLAEDTTHVDQWTEAMEAWHAVEVQHKTAFTPDVESAWQKTRTQLDLCAPSIDLQAESPAEEVILKPTFAWSSYLRYAAVILIAVGLGWLGYTQWNSSSQWAQVATLTGERKVIYLPDSSQVTLNGNSTLRYRTAFNQKEREVELTGEAFFQVKKNPSQPFIVHSGEADTRVLGTSFNVRAVTGEKEVSVAVMTGKVAFSTSSKKKEVVLTPGFTGKLHADGSLAKEETGATKPTWNTLTFKGATLQEVSDQIGKYFGVTVQLPSTSLAQCTFTGTFENPELTNIIQVLTVSNNIRLQKTAPGVYKITGEGCDN